MATDSVRDYLRAIGAKGGRIGGKRRLETMTNDERSEAARLAAEARWSLTRGPIEWAIGTRFRIAFDEDGRRVWTDNWVITGYTPTSIIYYKPEYDGTNRQARRSRRDVFQAHAKSGIIRRMVDA